MSRSSMLKVSIRKNLNSKLVVKGDRKSSELQNKFLQRINYPNFARFSLSYLMRTVSGEELSV